jgi:hypothetical protein
MKDRAGDVWMMMSLLHCLCGRIQTFEEGVRALFRHRRRRNAMTVLSLKIEIVSLAEALWIRT